MFRNILLCAVLAFGAVESYPQHRFALPAHFSFKTVHTPGNFPGSSLRSSKLTIPTPIQPSLQSFKAVPAVNVVQPHVPVVVEVPQDFVGDSVLVTAEDLNNFGLNGAIVDNPMAMTIVEEAADVPLVVDGPVDEGAIIEEASVGSLSSIDDSFVLTPSEPQAETIDVISEYPASTVVESAIVPDIIEQVITPVEELIVEPVVETIESIPTVTLSPFHTDTFNAYNDFLNTWLRLASVNLNRPDLLTLVNDLSQVSVSPQEIVSPQIIPSVETVPIQEISIVETQSMDETPISEPEVPIVDPQVFQASEPLYLLDNVEVEPITPVGAVADVVHEIQSPVSEFAPEITTEAPADVTTESMPIEIEVTTEDFSVATQSVVEVVVSDNSITTEVVPQETLVEDTLLSAAAEPFAIQEEIITNSIVPVVESEPRLIFVESPKINSQPETVVVPEPTLSDAQVFPLHRTVPTFTSRGRLSGFRYSFSHVPQRGSFFLHPLAG